MPDPIFRPGDRVRCVNPGPTSLVLGQVYTVKLEFWPMVELVGNGNLYYQKRFRRVEEVPA